MQISDCTSDLPNPYFVRFICILEFESHWYLKNKNDENKKLDWILVGEKKNRYKRHKRPKPQNPRMCYASLYVVLARCCLNGKQSSDVFNNRKLKGDNTPSSWKNVT